LQLLDKRADFPSKLFYPRIIDFINKKKKRTKKKKKKEKTKKKKEEKRHGERDVPRQKSFPFKRILENGRSNEILAERDFASDHHSTPVSAPNRPNIPRMRDRKRKETVSSRYARTRGTNIPSVKAAFVSRA